MQHSDTVGQPIPFRATYLPFLLRIAAHLTSGDLVVQVGNAKGPGVTDFAKAILSSGADVQHYVVDPMGGTALYLQDNDGETVQQRIVTFMERVKPFAMAGHNVKLLVANYVEGADVFADNSADLVFLDGIHDEATLAATIRRYYHVVAVGGYLAGNDYAMVAVADAIAAELPVDLVKVENTSGWPYWFIRKREATTSGATAEVEVTDVLTNAPVAAGAPA